MKRNLKVHLTAVEGGSLLDYPGPDLKPKRYSETVPTLRAAQDLCNRWRDSKNLTAANWPADGQRVTERGKPVAYFSYNGRAWSPDDERREIDIDAFDLGLPSAGMVVWLAALDTRHFHFQAVGASEEEAKGVLLEGWARHCRGYPSADPDYLRQAIEHDEVEVTPLRIGVCLRDGTPLERARTRKKTG